jgi:predicted peroxiredoxin
MPGLKIIVLTADAERFRGALTIAAAHAALGQRTAIMLQHEAVGLLRQHIAVPGDAMHAAHGMPALETLLDGALLLGVEVVACQSGLTLCGLAAQDLDPVSFLQDMAADDRLTLV